MNNIEIKTQHTLIALAIEKKGNWEAIMKTIKAKDMKTSEEAYAKAVELYERGEAITILDKGYPTEFRNMHKPPFVLFLEGNKDLLKEEHKIAFFGRNAEKAYDKRNARDLAYYVIGSKKTAVFKDNALTEKAIAGIGKGKVILVCQNSLEPGNLAYAKEKVLEIGGLVITEIPYGAVPEKDSIALSDRLVANLCDKVVVIECKHRSTTLLAVSYALAANKDIGCVPHSINEADDACNDLIREGACLIRNGQDIFDM